MGIMNIVKISGFLLDDITPHWSEEFLHDVLRDNLKTKPRHLHIEIAEVDNSELVLMNENVDLAHCEKYFKSKPTKFNTERTVEVGSVYKHFKEGKLVKVLVVSQDTENVGSYSVVYECLDDGNKGKVWHRPYDMFLSEVDHEKYPNAKQKYRFERVD